MVSSKMVLFGVLLKHTQFKYPMCCMGEVSHSSVGIRYSVMSSLLYLVRASRARTNSRSLKM